jgi:hypothetical protein
MLDSPACPCTGQQSPVWPSGRPFTRQAAAAVSTARPAPSARLSHLPAASQHPRCAAAPPAAQSAPAGARAGCTCWALLWAALGSPTRSTGCLLPVCVCGGAPCHSLHRVPPRTAHLPISQGQQHAGIVGGECWPVHACSAGPQAARHTVAAAADSGGVHSKQLT